LSVTAGAVSQHLRRAEERLGIVLFDRTPRGLVPTEALAHVLPQLAQGFRDIEGAIKALKGSDEAILTVTMGSIFASRWLIWRINQFNIAHPDIEVRLVVTGNLLDLTRLDIDCGIRFGDGVWPGLVAEPLMRSSISPVCAPALAARLKTPADLADLPVIRDESTMLSWSDWLAAAGVGPVALNGPSYLDPTLAFDAAIAEQGVLLAVDMMSDHAVREGRLVRPFATKLRTDRGYWFAVPEGRREARKTRIFRQWLHAQLREDGS